MPSRQKENEPMCKQGNARINETIGKDRWLGSLKVCCFKQ